MEKIIFKKMRCCKKNKNMTNQMNNHMNLNYKMLFLKDIINFNYSLIS